MNIQFIQQGMLSQHEVDHLVQSFFDEDVQIELLNLEQPLELEMLTDEQLHSFELIISARLEDVLEGEHAPRVASALVIDRNRRTASYRYQPTIEDKLSEEEQRRALKQSLLHALVKVLEEVTGVKQPWGILSGVRPTKLMHRFRREGRTETEVKQHFEKHLLLQPEKCNLLLDIVARQIQVIPDFDQIDQEVSIYIGIPFCPTKCAYCTFPAYAIQRKGNVVEQFLQGLELEIKAIGAWLRQEGRKITTIYVGGGTPTSIEAEELERLFQTMAHHFDTFSDVRELTVEAGRPDTITAEKLEVMRKWQVDRISINPQSFTQLTLDLIGRHHTVEETIKTYQLARQYGFNNINMDLIIGLPGEGLRELEHTLTQVERLKPESLTIHTLSFKRASAMTKDREKYIVADREEIKKMMRLASKWTAQEAYYPYYLYRQKNILGNLENVGYALAGQESLYNILIMEEAQTIIGLGCGAVSKIIPPGTRRNTRWPNPKDPQTYVATHESMIRKKLADLTRLYGQERDAEIVNNLLQS